VPPSLISRLTFGASDPLKNSAYLLGRQWHLAASGIWHGISGIPGSRSRVRLRGTTRDPQHYQIRSKRSGYKPAMTSHLPFSREHKSSSGSHVLRSSPAPALTGGTPIDCWDKAFGDEMPRFGHIMSILKLRDPCEILLCRLEVTREELAKTHKGQRKRHQYF
jgi:hypothetical protein